MITIAGETIVDLIESRGGQFSAFTGGGPYNVARAAAKMGSEVGYISPISTDAFGAMFAAEMESLGIVPLSKKSEKNSGLAIIKKDTAGVPSYIFYREDAADRDITLDGVRAAMPSSKVFYVGGLALVSGADAEVWAEFVGELACPVFVDPNVRPSFIDNREQYLQRLARVYDAVSIVKLSDEDCAWLAPDSPPEIYLKKIMESHDIALGLLTRGAEGAEAFLKGNDKPVCTAPAIKITVRDTVGAGDCFSAGILSSIVGYENLETFIAEGLQAALNYSVAAAALVCSRDGAAAPSHDEITDFMS